MTCACAAARTGVFHPRGYLRRAITRVRGALVSGALWPLSVMLPSCWLVEEHAVTGAEPARLCAFFYSLGHHSLPADGTVWTKSACQTAVDIQLHVGWIPWMHMDGYNRISLLRVKETKNNNESRPSVHNVLGFGQPGSRITGRAMTLSSPRLLGVPGRSSSAPQARLTRARHALRPCWLIPVHRLINHPSHMRKYSPWPHQRSSALSSLSSPARPFLCPIPVPITFLAPPLSPSFSSPWCSWPSIHGSSTFHVVGEDKNAAVNICFITRGSVVGSMHTNARPVPPWHAADRESGERPRPLRTLPVNRVCPRSETSKPCHTLDGPAGSWRCRWVAWSPIVPMKTAYA